MSKLQEDKYDVSLILLPLLSSVFIFSTPQQYYYVAGTIAFILVLAFSDLFTY